LTVQTPTPPKQFLFDPTPEIFATDSGGAFQWVLAVNGQPYLPTGTYDEVRFVFSLWHPSNQRTIDLDRGYVEIRAAFQGDDAASAKVLHGDEEHWTKIAEIEPVVPPYAGGESFDGWIVLPVLGSRTAFAIYGSGFEPRARLQIRASAYFVA
jgi:hypothetical protein